MMIGAMAKAKGKRFWGMFFLDMSFDALVVWIVWMFMCVFSEGDSDLWIFQSTNPNHETGTLGEANIPTMEGLIDYVTGNQTWQWKIIPPFVGD
jgi:hypothetical protein